MLAADSLLEALNKNDDTEECNLNNVFEDYDLDDVLSYFGDVNAKYKLRFSDGTKGYLSFDD